MAMATAKSCSENLTCQAAGHQPPFCLECSPDEVFKIIPQMWRVQRISMYMLTIATIS